MVQLMHVLRSELGTSNCLQMWSTASELALPEARELAEACFDFACEHFVAVLRADHCHPRPCAQPRPTAKEVAGARSGRRGSRSAEVAGARSGRRRPTLVALLVSLFF